MTTASKLAQLGVWSAEAAQNAAGDLGTGLVATGSTQATALAITNDICVFATVAASTGCILPFQGAAYITIFNNGANSLAVYPPVGGTINGGAANASFATLAGKSAVYITPDGTTWVATHSG
jgi:hypothetical protein